MNESDEMFNKECILDTKKFLSMITMYGNSGYDAKQIIKMLKSARKKYIYSEIAARKESIIKNHGSRCDICGFNYEPVLQIHHILPVRLFGGNEEKNIACLCPNCHKIMHKTYEVIKKDSVDEALKMFLWLRENYGDESYLAYCDMMEQFGALQKRTRKMILGDGGDVDTD